MCGICGEFVFGAAAGSVDPDVLSRMTDRLAHRGPDARGTWMDPERRVGLGHTRLKILDLSDAGNQPMANEDGTIRLTFNGELYNFQALRERLAGRHRFQSRSDTESLVHLYEEDGDRALESLDGMFAFALWDGARRRLLLARDPAGKKPLYFARRPDRLVFASEPKALFAHPAVARELSPDAVDAYFTFGFVPAPRTMFQGVEKLPAGHCLVADASGAIEIRRYWQPEVEPALARMDDAALQREALARLRAAVRKRLVADVPVAVFLSGGVDSSLVTALAAEASPQPLATFSVGYDRHAANEDLAFARMVAARYGTRHTELVMPTDVALASLDDVLGQYDDLVNDSSIPFYFLAKAAHAQGIKVVLIGEGSDEVFSGYPFLGSVQRYASWLEPLAAVPRALRHALAGPAIPMAERTRHYFAAEMLESWRAGDELFWGLDVLFRYGRRERLFAPAFGRQLNGGDAPAAVVGRWHEDYRQRYSGPRLARWHYVESQLHLPDYLLARADKGSMQFAVECRAPFLDRRLLTFALSVPDRVKQRHGQMKYLLKRAAEAHLPRELVYRPKRPLPVPYLEWLRQGLLDDVLRTPDPILNASYVEELRGRVRAGASYYGDKLWSIYLFKRWLSRWFGA